MVGSTYEKGCEREDIVCNCNIQLELQVRVPHNADSVRVSETTIDGERCSDNTVVFRNIFSGRFGILDRIVRSGVIHLKFCPECGAKYE